MTPSRGSAQRGRVAVVTGGAGGIGAATAHRLARDGATVAVLDLDGAGASAVAAGLPSDGLGLACDITDPGAVRAAVAAVVDRFGRVDVLVNNAGLLHDDAFLDLDPATWAQAVTVNLTGPFTMTREVGAVMAAAGYGRIVFVSSLAERGNRAQAGYAAAKAGVAGLARTVALELGEFGVTANVVAPGRVDTGMLAWAMRAKGRTVEDAAATAAATSAVRRIGRPEDIAAAIAFFAAPDSGFVTGQVLYATGDPGP